jgi:hypothetical protein
MDKDDRRINLSSFWFGKDEIKNYFFPSLVRDTTEEEIKSEVKRISILPDEDGLTIIRKSIGVIENPLIDAILNNNEEMLEELIDGEERDGSVYINQGRLIIQVDKLPGDAEDVDNCIDHYRMEGNNGWEWVHGDIENRFYDGDEFKIDLEVIFSKYYKDNESRLRHELGVRTYEQFKEGYFENYYNNEHFKDYYIDDATDLSYQSYEAENDKEADRIEKYMSFGSRSDELNFSIVFFVQFLINKGIKRIGYKTDDDNSLSIQDVSNMYISFYNLTTEIDEPIYEYDYKAPVYGENNYITKETDKYFDKIFDNPENTSRCIELRKLLNDIIDKFFNGGWGNNRFENDHVKVILRSMAIDCDTESVKIDFTNKDTNQSYYGRYVKVENLPRYLTNYELDLKESKLTLSSLIYNPKV